MSARIEGLSREESEDALDQLFDISEDPPSSTSTSGRSATS